MPQTPLEITPSEVNRFLTWADLGHTPDLLPIVPAGTPVSQFAGKNITPEKLGKIPSKLLEDGAVGLRDWPVLAVSHETLVTWHNNLSRLPYGIGLNSRTFHAWDIDANDENFARLCWQVLAPFMREAALGFRVGRAPGFLIPFRCESPWTKQRVAVVDDATGLGHAVDFLAHGQYYNIEGIHPKTGQPYRWYVGPDGTSDLTNTPRDAARIVPDALVAETWERLVAVLSTHYRLAERARPPRKAAEGSGEFPSPAEHLAPDVALVADCLNYLPNDRAAGRTRDDWLAIIRAVATATNKSADGLALILEWSAHWDCSEAAADNARRAWASIECSRSQIGFRWLARKASVESGGRCTAALALDFGDETEPPPFEGPPIPEGVTMVTPPPPSRADIDALVDVIPLSGFADAVAVTIRALAASNLDPVNVTDILKTIKARTKLDLKTLRKQLGGEMARGDAGVFDVPQRLALAVLGTYGKDHIAHHNGEYHLYDGRCWQRTPPDLILNTMREVANDQPMLMMSAGDARPQNITTAISQGEKLLSWQTHDRLAILSDPVSVARPAINVKNGTLWVSPDGSVALKPHNADDAFLHVCDVDYDPTADCPRFDAVMRDVMSKTSYTVSVGDPDYVALRRELGDAEAASIGELRVERGGGTLLKVTDIAENVRMTTELMSYCLTPWRGAAQFVICKGNGRNGKSMLWQTVQKFLPAAAVHVGGIEHFASDRFMLGELAGKLLTLTDDAEHRVRLDDGVLKMISENKMLTAAVKYGRPMTFYCCAFPVILSNSWPVTDDLSAGMRARALILPFNRVYGETEQQASPWPGIWRDRREMSGIFNRLLQALARVVQRGRILPSRAAHEAFHHWVEVNAVELEFIGACCVTKPSEETRADGDTANDLYAAFKSWYAAQFGSVFGVHKGQRFRDTIEQLGYEVYRTGKYGWRVRGLWLNPAVIERGLGVSYIEPQDDDG